MNRYLHIIINITAILFCTAFASCKQFSKVKSLPPSYDLGAPEKFFMPPSLIEVSGIAFYKGSSDTVFCIQDEEGKVFRLPWGVKKQYNAKFGKKGDYEDLAMVGEQVYILKSNGTLFAISKKDTWNEDVDSVIEWKDLLPGGEYESMYGDHMSGKLYVLCKKCGDDADSDRVTGYVLDSKDPATGMTTFFIRVGEIRAFDTKLKKDFRPSGLARNPLTGEWFIISGVNKLLVTADPAWKVTGAYHLNSNEFNQPEGIAFDNAGNLYISNEGDDLSEGTILRFSRKIL